MSYVLKERTFSGEERPSGRFEDAESERQTDKQI
jgi:hypothetical protein